MEDPQIRALVNAHWNEFMAEEILLAQGNAGVEREADEGGQLQVAIHKLERAKMEVACYSSAISKIARTMNLVHRDSTDYGESGFPTTDEILISHQVRAVIVPTAAKTYPARV